MHASTRAQPAAPPYFSRASTGPMTSSAPRSTMTMKLKERVMTQTHLNETNTRQPWTRSPSMDSPESFGFDTCRNVKTSSPATRKVIASMAIAIPDPKAATSSPPIALPAIRPPFDATLM